jgi:hypothetical protein
MIVRQLLAAERLSRSRRRFGFALRHFRLAFATLAVSGFAIAIAMALVRSSNAYLARLAGAIGDRRGSPHPAS